MKQTDVTLPVDVRTPKAILEYCNYNVDQLRSALLKLSPDEIRAMTWTLEDINNIPIPMSRIVYDALYYGHTPSQNDWPEKILKEFFGWIVIINF